METITIVPDQQTVVLGGLVRDNVTFNESKIPLLGDIPGLGWLFKSRSQQLEKVNLLVFLTPTVVRDRVDMVEMSEKKRGEIEPLLKENRIDETPQVNRALDRLITAPQAERGPALDTQPETSLQHGLWNESDARLIIDHDLLARLKRTVKLDGDR